VPTLISKPSQSLRNSCIRARDSRIRKPDKQSVPQAQGRQDAIRQQNVRVECGDTCRCGPVVCNAHRHRPFHNKCVWYWSKLIPGFSGQPTPNQLFQMRYRLSRHLASIHGHSVCNLLDNDALLPLPLSFVHARSQVPQVVCRLSFYRLLHLPLLGLLCLIRLVLCFFLRPGFDASSVSRV